MDEKLVISYYELNEKLKDLQEERDQLNQIIKDEMIKSNMTKATVGRYDLEIKVQDRSKYDDTIVKYLKKSGMKDLIIESYDEVKLKERIKTGKIDENAINQYKVEKFIHVLYVKPN